MRQKKIKLGNCNAGFVQMETILAGTLIDFNQQQTILNKFFFDKILILPFVKFSWQILRNYSGKRRVFKI